MWLSFPKGSLGRVNTVLKLKYTLCKCHNSNWFLTNGLLFYDQIGILISAGTIYNFNEEAYHHLEMFEAIAKSKLIHSDLIHVDETGINENGKHSLGNAHHLGELERAFDVLRLLFDGKFPDFMGEI